MEDMEEMLNKPGATGGPGMGPGMGARLGLQLSGLRDKRSPASKGGAGGGDRERDPGVSKEKEKGTGGMGMHPISVTTLAVGNRAQWVAPR